jgi:nicotinamidase-related amidase
MVHLADPAAVGRCRAPAGAAQGGGPPLAGLEPDEQTLVATTSGLDGFFGTALDAALWTRGISHLILAGFGTETAVHSTLRSANDRGFECLTVSDACADGDPELHAAAFSSLMMSGGIFGAHATTAAVLELLAR